MSSFQNLCLKISDFYKKSRKNLNFADLPMLIHEKFQPKKQAERNFSNERKFVAALIMDVLTAKLCVREAVLKFPKDCEDVSLKVAWHSIMHYEADEDLSKPDPTYQAVQIDFLEMIYNELKDGKELPQNLIMDYNIYHNDVVTSGKNGLVGIWEKLTRKINT